MTEFEQRALKLLEEIRSELSSISGDLGVALHGGMPFRCVVEERPKPKRKP